MQTSDILTSKGDHVIAVSEDTTVLQTAETLARERVGAVVVGDGGQPLAGIMSERDIVRNMAGRGSAALEVRLADLMNRSIVTCSPEDNANELMEQMLTERIRHLPVRQDDKLVGTISIGDVVKAVLSDLKWMTKALEGQVVTAARRSADED